MRSTSTARPLPAYASTPVHRDRFQQLAGAAFGCRLRRLRPSSRWRCVDASRAGVKVNASVESISQGNYIGLGLNGARGRQSRQRHRADQFDRQHHRRHRRRPNATSSPPTARTASASSGSSNNQICGQLHRHRRDRHARPRQRQERHPDCRASLVEQHDRRRDGNVISGNDANGVLIKGKSRSTPSAGNLIGTNAAGTAALGNGQRRRRDREVERNDDRQLPTPSKA